MDAHASATTAAAEEHHHPSSGTYIKIGLVLFVLTALEVGLYEFTYGEHAGSTGIALQPFFVPLLLALSAAKFALVAMFYMHLKQDHRLFSGLLVFPLIIATVVILALIVLEAYHFAFARSG
jgi:cytochrome c oxidase subunit 4